MVELINDGLEFAFPEMHPRARLRVTFQRTLRIPDDGSTYFLPPGLGTFPVTPVDEVGTRAPAAWTAKVATAISIELPHTRATRPPCTSSAWSSREKPPTQRRYCS